MILIFFNFELDLCVFALTWLKENLHEFYLTWLKCVFALIWMKGNLNEFCLVE